MTKMYPTEASSARPSGVPMYDEMKCHEVQVLRKAGFSLRQIAEKAEVGLNTVLRILGKVPPESDERPRVGRPPVALRYTDIARRISTVGRSGLSARSFWTLVWKGIARGGRPRRGPRSGSTPP